MKTVAYQGVKGAFSYMTAVMKFGEGQCYLGLPTFREVFEKVAAGTADYGVIPVENSLIGRIEENCALLREFGLHIAGEEQAKIEQCLLATHKDLSCIKKVISHPKALAQCASFFKSHPWIEAAEFVDTAAAAEEVAKLQDPSLAAIASPSAAELYGLEMVEKGIADKPENYTRFVVLSKKEIRI